MKAWYKSLSISFKVAVLSFVIVVLLGLVTSFCYFINFMSISNGIFLGGLVGSISYLGLGFAEIQDNKKQRPIWTIIATILRFIVIAGVIVLAGFYRDIFNPFAVIGAYAVPLLISIIYYIVIYSSIC